MMGGGSTGYDPQYGYGAGGSTYGLTSRGGYSGQSRDYSRSYDYNRSDWRERDRSREEREDPDRGLLDRISDTLASWFGDEDAERRRRMDETQNRQHRGRGPRGYKRSDDRIKEDVNDRLSDHPYLDASDIEVEVVEAEVILTGNVDNRRDKRLAEDLAEAVSGVNNVENRIRVRRSDQGSSTGASGTMGTTGATSTSGTAGTGTGGTATRAAAAGGAGSSTGTTGTGTSGTTTGTGTSGTTTGTTDTGTAGRSRNR
jgi:osmotically-inducible protein OsmY